MADDYLAAKERAQRYYDGAFHLLKVTFPLANDPKILIGVVHHLYLCMESCMEAILEHDQQLQLVPLNLPTFERKLAIFCSKSARRYVIPDEMIASIASLHEIIELHKKSPMEFQRGNRFVISTSNYELKVISIQEIKSYLEQAEQLLAITGKVLNTYFNRK